MCNFCPILFLIIPNFGVRHPADQHLGDLPISPRPYSEFSLTAKASSTTISWTISTQCNIKYAILLLALIPHLWCGYKEASNLFTECFTRLFNHIFIRLTLYYLADAKITQFSKYNKDLSLPPQFPNVKYVQCIHLLKTYIRTLIIMSRSVLRLQ